MADSRFGERPLEAIYERTLDSLPINVAILDTSGEIVQTNRSWREFGRDDDIAIQASTVGVNYLEVCDADDDEYATRAADGIRTVIAEDQELFTFEYPCHTPDEKRWFLMRSSSFESMGERFVVVAHVNITDRKQAELDAQARADELEEKRRNLVTLNRVIRHDIRNEMDVIIRWGNILETQLEEESPGLEYMMTAADETVRLTETIGTLVTELNSADDLPLEPIRLRPVLENEAEKARAKNPALTVDGLEDVPPELAVEADEMLSSVFVNLFNNAVSHSDRAEPTIHVACTRADGTVTVTIEDDGPGISDERKETVFGRGEKGIESDGTGLGLYLVDTTVQRYDGTVSVEDAEPRGARFRVTVPEASV